MGRESGEAGRMTTGAERPGPHDGPTVCGRFALLVRPQILLESNQKDLVLVAPGADRAMRVPRRSEGLLSRVRSGDDGMRRVVGTALS